MSASTAEFLLSPEGQAKLTQLAASTQLVLDLDDTLNTNQPLYTEAHAALREVFAQLATEPAEDPMDYTQLCREINNQHLAELGYTPKRWRLCAQLTAQQLAGRELTSQESAAVAEAAELALGPGELMEGVEDTLRALKQAGVRMVIKTKGEQTIQTHKLQFHQLHRFFGTDMEIVQAKNAESFRELAQRYEFSNPVSIGDSRTSDVLPALEAGYSHAVLINHGWRWDDANYTDQDGLETVSNFPDAVATLLK